MAGILSTLSAVNQLVHLSANILKNLSEFRAIAKDGTKEFQHAQEELDHLRLTLQALMEEFDVRIARDEIQRGTLQMLSPMIEKCADQVSFLERYFQKVSKESGYLITKATSSKATHLNRRSRRKMENALRDLHENIETIETLLTVTSTNYINSTTDASFLRPTSVDATSNRNGLAHTVSATLVGLKSINDSCTVDSQVAPYFGQSLPPLVGFNEAR